MRRRLIVFDFDGVVADSEWAANVLGAAAVSAEGLPMSPEEHLNRYMGKSWADYFALVAQDLGRPLPDGYAAARRAELDAAEDTIGAIAGLSAFIDRFGDAARCVASSNDLGYLHRMLARFDLAHRFGGVFSATQVARGKPWPDLFLHAAATMGVPPDDAVVIEDSPAGVRAGVAAGMRTLGLCAGTHCRPDHAERLRAAGAEATAASYAEAEAIVAAWLAA